MKIHKTFLVVTLFLICSCVTNKNEYRDYIASYDGNAKIRVNTCYATVIFGVEYLEYIFPTFQFVDSMNISFNIGKLPETLDSSGGFQIYLFVPDNVYHEDILTGITEITIYEDSRVYCNVVDTLKNYNHGFGEGGHDFVYRKWSKSYNSYQRWPQTLFVKNPNSKWRITLKYTNPGITEKKVIGYFNYVCGACNPI